jgi:hypothetical protein
MILLTAFRNEEHHDACGRTLPPDQSVFAAPDRVVHSRVSVDHMPFVVVLIADGLIHLQDIGSGSKARPVLRSPRVERGLSFWVVVTTL